MKEISLSLRIMEPCNGNKCIPFLVRITETRNTGLKSPEDLEGHDVKSALADFSFCT